MIEITRTSPDGLEQQCWTFTIIDRHFELELRWYSYEHHVRSSKRHKFYARGSTPRVYWTYTDCRNNIGERPSTVPDDVLAEVKQCVVDSIKFVLDK